MDPTMTETELFAAFRKIVPQFDIAFLINCAEAAALAAKPNPTRIDAARMAYLWRMFTEDGR